MDVRAIPNFPASPTECVAAFRCTTRDQPITRPALTARVTPGSRDRATVDGSSPGDLD